MSENQNNGQTQQTVIVVQKQSNVLGILSIVFSVISFLALAHIFVPLGLILGIIACFKKQLGLGITGIILSIISGILSPSVWGLLLGLAIRIGIMAS